MKKFRFQNGSKFRFAHVSFHSALTFLFLLPFLSVQLNAETASLPDASETRWLKLMNVDQVTDYSGLGVNAAVIDDAIHAHTWFKDNIQTSLTQTNSSFKVQGRADGDYDAVELIISTIDGAEPSSASESHGTRTAGSLVQAANDVTLTVIKTDLSTITIPTNIRTAVEKGAQIISNSYGSNAGYSGLCGFSDPLAGEFGSGFFYLTAENGKTVWLSENTVSQMNFYEAFEEAEDANTVILYSAGNQRASNIGKTNGQITQYNSQDANKIAFQAAPQTITVAALNSEGTKYASFSNYGACILTCAPGTSITTSSYDFDSGTDTTATVSGTSFSCPLAAGAVALAAEAAEEAGLTMNSRLAKHLIAATAVKVDSEAENIGWAVSDGTTLTSHDARSAWVTNMAGNSFSHSYGFGLIDAAGMCEMIQQGVTLTEQSILTVDLTDLSDLSYSTEDIACYVSGLAFGNSSSAASCDVTASASVQLTTFSTVETSTSSYSGFSATASPLSTPVSSVSMAVQDLAVGIAAETVSVGDAYVVIDGQQVRVDSGTQLLSRSFSIDEALIQGVTFQSLEEVSLTVGMSGTLGALEFVLTHTAEDGRSTSSILAFAQESSEGLDLTEDGVYWTFSSNAFWGEEAEGEWTLDIYDMFDLAESEENSTEFYLDSLYATFRMGDLVTDTADLLPGEIPGTGNGGSSVPEPSALLLLLFGTTALWSLKGSRKTK